MLAEGSIAIDAASCDKRATRSTLHGVIAFFRPRAIASGIVIAAAGVACVAVVACSSDAPSADAADALPPASVGDASATDATLAMTGGDADDGAPDASSGDASPDAAACQTQFGELEGLLDASACGQCELALCPSFESLCQNDCRCVDAVLALLTCLTIGQNVQKCQSETVSKLTTTELTGLIECNGICSKPCSAATFFPEAGADGSTLDASDASADADAGDAADS